MWEEAATSFARIGRGRIARHACAFLRAHSGGLERLRKAVEGSDTDGASAALRELQSAWAAAQPVLGAACSLPGGGGCDAAMARARHELAEAAG